MSRFNTGNPLGSGSPLDLDDNAKNMDEAANSSADTFQDRLGKSRLTWAGIVKAGSGDPAIAVDAASRAVGAADRAESAESSVEQNAEQVAQDAAQQAASAVIAGVDGQVAVAQSAADRAETARDAAFVSANVYESQAAGRSATATGEQFIVVYDHAMIRYRKDVGGNVEVARYFPYSYLKGVFTVANTHAYLTNLDEPWSLEEKSTTFGLHLKFEGIRFHDRTSTAYVQKTWEDVKADINNPSLFETSPNGVDDSLFLNDKTLVFNLNTLKIEIVDSRNKVDLDKHFVLLTPAYGRPVDGFLQRLYSSTAASKITELSNIDLTLSAAVYIGGTDGLLYTQQKYTPFSMLIKHGTIRIHDNRNTVYTSKTWEDVKADINNPALFVTSDDGVTECLKLENDVYVYNTLSKKMEIVDFRYMFKQSKYIPLMSIAYGQPTGGRLNEIDISRKVESLQNRTVGATTSIMNDPQLRLCAHRGVNGNWAAPENSLPAFRLAAEYGYWGAETDLRLTSDGHWVILHDETVDRTTNGTGAVSSMTLSQIKALDLNFVSSTFSGEKIPTLREFLELCKTYGIVPYCQTYVSPAGADGINLLKEINEVIGLDAVVLTSFEKTDLIRLRELSPSVALEYLAPVTQDAIEFAKGIGNCSIGASHTTLTDEKILSAANAGIRLSAWSPKQDDTLLLSKKNIQRITTDYSIVPSFKSGFQTDLIKNNSGWTNAVITGTHTISAGTLVLQSGGTAEIDIGARPMGVVIVHFDAMSENKDAVVKISGAPTYVNYTVDSDTFTTHGVSTIIRSAAVQDIKISFTASTGELQVRNVKIDVFEV